MTFQNSLTLLTMVILLFKFHISLSNNGLKWSIPFCLPNCHYSKRTSLIINASSMRCSPGIFPLILLFIFINDITLFITTSIIYMLKIFIYTFPFTLPIPILENKNILYVSPHLLHSSIHPLDSFFPF